MFKAIYNVLYALVFAFIQNLKKLNKPPAIEKWPIYQQRHLLNNLSENHSSIGSAPLVEYYQYKDCIRVEIRNFADKTLSFNRIILEFSPHVPKNFYEAIKTDDVNCYFIRLSWDGRIQAIQKFYHFPDLGPALVLQVAFKWNEIYSPIDLNNIHTYKLRERVNLLQRYFKKSRTPVSMERIKLPEDLAPELIELFNSSCFDKEHPVPQIHYAKANVGDSGLFLAPLTTKGTPDDFKHY